MIPVPNGANASSNNEVVMQYVVYQVPSSEVVIAESWLERRHISRLAQPVQQQQQHLSTTHIFDDIESAQVCCRSFVLAFDALNVVCVVRASTIALARCSLRWRRSISSRSPFNRGTVFDAV